MVASTTLAAASSDPGSTPELRPGEVLARKYLLVRPLGLGGMGQVWLAQNTATGAEVAAKVLLPARASSPDAIMRFRREAHATAALSHRGIVRVFDLVELDAAQGSLVLVMELLRGHTLGERLEQQGKLTIEETLDVVLPILSGLAHAHGAGVVHRDLKPENIFLAVEPDGQMLPKLLDFGISKSRHGAMTITADGELVGTPCYMSPEQACGRDVDERSDVFAVGILLYECLTGGNPFLADGLHLVVQAVLEMEPEPIADVPPALWAVIAKALAKHPEQRFASARELADALRAAMPAHTVYDAPPARTTPSPSLSTVPPSVVAPSSPHESAARPRPRGRVVAIGIAACVAAMSLASAAASFGAPRRTVHASIEAPTRATIAKRVERTIDTRVIAPTDATALIARPSTPPAAAPSLAVLPIPPPLPHAHRHVVVLRDPGF